jgi:hypothetical protein
MRLQLPSRRMSSMAQPERGEHIGAFSREWALHSATAMPLSPGGERVIKTLVPFSPGYGQRDWKSAHCFSEHEPPQETIIAPASLTMHLCPHEQRVGVYV